MVGLTYSGVFFLVFQGHFFQASTFRWRSFFSRKSEKLKNSEGKKTSRDKTKPNSKKGEDPKIPSSNVFPSSVLMTSKHIKHHCCKALQKISPRNTSHGWWLERNQPMNFLESLAKADTSRDGRIDFEEFQAIMQNKAAIAREEKGKQQVTRWWFRIFFMFSPIRRNDPI